MPSVNLRNIFSLQNWRRKLLVASLLLVGFIVLLVGFAALYIRSEQFNQFVISQIKANAVLYGLRVEVGNFGFSWQAGQAELKNVKVFNKKTDRLLLEVQQAELSAIVPDAYELKLQRQIILQQLKVKGLKVFLEFNPDGSSSFTGLEAPKDTGSSSIEVNNSQLDVAITDSSISLKDGLNQVAFSLNNFGLTAKLKGATQATIALNGNNGEVALQDNNTKIESIAIKGQISDKGLQLEPSEIVTSLGKIKLSGELNDWKKLEHQVNFQAQTQALEIADLKIKGQTELEGKLVGNGDSTKLTGRLNLADLKVNKANTHITGLQVPNLELVTGGSVNLTTEKVKVQSAVVDTISAANIDIPNLKASISNKNLELALPKLVAGNLAVPKGQISGLELNEIALKILEKQVEAKVKQILAANIAVPNVKANSLKLSQVTAQVKGSNYKVNTDLALAKAVLNNLEANQTTAKVQLENNILTLSKLESSLLGGKANLELQLALSGKSPSHLQTKFQEINSADLGKLLKKESLPVTGLISGNGELSWPGLDFLRATGELKAIAQGQTKTKSNNLPLTADILVQAQDGKLNIKPLTAKLGETKLVAQATISPKDNMISAQYKVESSKAEQLFLLAKSLKLFDEKILSNNPEIAGNLKVTGQISGLLDKPNITSDFQLQNLALQGNKFQNLVGNLKITPEDIQLTIDKLSDKQGGNLQLVYQGKSNDPANTGQLKANINNLHLTLYNADKKEFFVGVINGKAEFTNLGERAEGNARLKLNSSKVADQVIDSGEFEVKLANQIADVNILSLEIAAAKINGRASLGLQTKDFTFQGKVNQLDIAKLNLNQDLAGIVEANIQASGNLDKLNNLQLDLEAESNNLRTSTNELGRLSLIAKTDSQGRIKAEITSYLIATQPQKVNILLSPNEPNYPLELESEISKLDLAILLAAFKVQAKDIISTNLSAQIAIKGNILNNKGEFNLDNFRGSVLLTSASLKLSDQPLNIETPCNISFDQGKLFLERMRVFSDGSDLVLSGKLSLNGNTSFDFTSNGAINLAQFSNLVPNSTLAGTAKLDVRLNGTTNQPNISGKIALSDLGFIRGDLPVELRNGNGVVILQNDKILLNNFSVRANDGQVKAAGHLDLKGFQPANLQVKLEARDINLIYQSAAMTLKGDLVLEGTPKNQVLKGTVKVLEASYSKPFDTSLLNNAGINTVDDGSKSAFSPELNINIDADSSIVVRNPQINTVASAAITLGGRVSNPNLSGRVSLEGGTITLRKQRYSITEGVMDLPGGILLPTVNVLAEGEINSYRVFIRFTGPIDQIDLALESEPSLTRTEILALITTGRPEVTGGENQDLTTTGLNTGANLIAQEFISKPFGRKAEQFLGLTQFQIDPIIRPNENPSARLTLGRQIIPKLSFTYSTSLATGKDQSIALEYSLSNRFSSLFSFTQGGGTSTKGTISDNVFSFEIRGRERFALGGKGEIATVPAISTITGYKPFTIATADVIVDKPKEIKISNDTLRDLLPIKKQAFSLPLTRLGEQNLTNYLQEKGYFFAKVSTRCEPVDCQGPDLKVYYQIVPGTHFEVREITITGTNLIPVASVISQLQSKPKNVFGKFPIIGNLPFIGGFADGITSSERLRQDSEFIRQQLVNLGYRQATVTSGYSTDIDGLGLRINFNVVEGEISRIGEINLLGTNALTQEELRKVVSINLGEAFNPSLPREAAQRLQEYYAQRGYLDTKIDVDLEQIDGNKIRLTYQIDEGSLATVYDIAFEGAESISEKSLRRFVDLKPGDPINNKKIQELQKQLYATGNFREIQVLTDPVIGANTTARHVRIKLTEAKPLLLVYGFGFSTDDGPRGSLELTNTNFFNKVVNSSLKLRLSSREQVVQMQLTDLRPFGSKWTSTFSTLYNRVSRLAGTSQQISNVDQAGLANNTNIGLSRFSTFLQTERRLTNHTSIRFRYNFELNKLLNIEDIQFNAFTETSRVTRLAILSAGSSYDTRDNPINPTKGQFFSFDYSLATRFLGGNESFNKINTTYQYYITPKENLPLPFINRSIIAFSSRIGLAAPFDIRSRRGDGIIRDSDMLLPFSERFRSGGATTLRGFTFESAGPQAVVETGNFPAKLVPLGGDALVVLNLELRYPISKRLQLVPFYDLGNVFSRIKDIDLHKMTNTVGLGLRFNTPIGPVGIDYGYLLDPQSFTTPNGGILKQRQGVIHIKFGQSF